VGAKVIKKFKKKFKSLKKLELVFSSLKKFENLSY